MRKYCEICNEEFDTNSSTRKYCYKCSGDSTRKDNETRKHQKTVLRRSMKLQAIKMLGGKCSKCGYDRCVDALEFHHENQDEKEFKLGSGNTMSWVDYKSEAMKCILVCSNCHKEIHSKIGYVFRK
jgi:5-methylcytosine-specific restriction endonuclease McrA